MARVKSLKSFGAPAASHIFFTATPSGTPQAPRVGRSRRPKLFYYLNSFTAAKGGGFPDGRPKAAPPPEDEGNPAEGGCFASYSIGRYLNLHK